MPEPRKVIPVAKLGRLWPEFFLDLCKFGKVGANLPFEPPELPHFFGVAIHEI
jgi:hypothetical protein